jgi:hypothetical protein
MFPGNENLPRMDYFRGLPPLEAKPDNTKLLLKILDKITDLERKVDNIFANHVLIDGVFVPIDLRKYRTKQDTAKRLNEIMKTV